MSSKKVFKQILEENAVGARNSVRELLYSKLKHKLNEKYIEISRTYFNEGKMEDIDGDGQVGNDTEDAIAKKFMNMGMPQDKAVAKAKGITAKKKKKK
jgi:hypothetical protein